MFIKGEFRVKDLTFNNLPNYVINLHQKIQEEAEGLHDNLMRYGVIIDDCSWTYKGHNWRGRLIKWEDNYYSDLMWDGDVYTCHKVSDQGFTSMMIDYFLDLSFAGYEKINQEKLIKIFEEG